MKPSVSVIVPTRNRASILPQALDSIYAQEGAGTQFDLEIIVVDDSSEDGTSEVVTHYPHLRYVRLPRNRGIGPARNAVIEASTGKYVAFLDDDDLVVPNKLSTQVAALEAWPEAGVAYGQVVIESEGGRLVFPEPDAPSGMVFRHLLFVNFCMLQSALIRRDAIERVGGFHEGTVEDYDIMLRLARDFPFVFVPAIVAIYRPSTGGVLKSSFLDGTHARALREVVEKALSWLSDAADDEATKRAARANLELRIAMTLLGTQTASAWQHLRNGLRQEPRIALLPRNRSSVAEAMGRYAATASSPLKAVAELWKEIGACLGVQSTQDRRLMCKLLAEAYWELAVARGKGIGCRRDIRTAIQAVAVSMRHQPPHVKRIRVLAQFLIRSITHRASWRPLADERRKPLRQNDG